MALTPIQYSDPSKVDTVTQAIASADSLDNIKTTGIYSFVNGVSPTSMPSDLSGLYLYYDDILTVSERSNGYIGQTLTINHYEGFESSYSRYYNGSTWSAWKKNEPFYKTIGSSDDLNNITASGIYTFGDGVIPTNKPSNVSNINKLSIMIVARTTDRITQQLIQGGTGAGIYARSYASSSWTDWTKIL